MSINTFKTNIPDWAQFSRHRFLLPFLIIILTFLLIIIFTRRKIDSDITRIGNYFCIILLLLSVCQISYFSLITNLHKTRLFVSNSTPVSEEKPDIYYIVLDTYAREDTLKRDFSFDNSAFIKELENLGFFVAKCSRSNYAYTQLSLSSSLNLDYIQNFSPSINPNNKSADYVVSYIKNSQVEKVLKQAGYKTVAFETGWLWNSWTDADYYYSPNSDSSMINRFNPFEAMLLKTTAFLAVIDSKNVLPKKILINITSPVQEHIDRQELIFNKLTNIATLEGPKFVYAHSTTLHAPFVFSSDGSILTDPGYAGDAGSPINNQYFLDGYKQGIDYTNERVIAIVNNIIEQSEHPPIIILQGDHGVRDSNRMDILNAYYLPSGLSNLYPSISPVNSFRIVFNNLFNSNLPLLPDQSWASSYEKPFQFSLSEEDSPICIH